MNVDNKKTGSLLLTRRVGEAIMLGKHTSFRIIRIKGNQVQIQIIAPKSLTILREELLFTLEEEEEDI